MKREHSEMDRTCESNDKHSPTNNPSKLSPKKQTFPVRSLHIYDKLFPFYRKPTKIGHFSTDSEKDFRDDNHMLSFYKPPPGLHDLNFDLRMGYKDFIRKNEDACDFINNILRWILLHKDKFSAPGQDHKNLKSLNTDFVCWRGLLRLLLCTPYERQEGWQVAVTLYNGTLYICEFETEKKKLERLSRSTKSDEMCYWGWKFEQYVTSESPESSPNPTVPVNNKAAFCAVIRTRLATNSLVFAGEVDAIDTTKTPAQYVELKTSREMSSQKQDDNMKRYKMLKWWAQSFLLDVPNIVVGFRDDDGVVHRMCDYQTLTIPEMVKTIANPWKPNVCFNFLNDLLIFLRTSVTIDDPRHVHLLSRTEGTGHATLADLGTDSSYVFLPTWYTDHFGT